MFFFIKISQYDQLVKWFIIKISLYNQCYVLYPIGILGYCEQLYVFEIGKDCFLMYNTFSPINKLYNLKKPPNSYNLSLNIQTWY